MVCGKANETKARPVLKRMLTDSDLIIIEHFYEIYSYDLFMPVFVATFSFSPSAYCSPEIL
jgi:hypothetical protein